MITVDSLCAEMARSGRPLTPRAARDWWSKGLLPPPRRQSLGRAGSTTYWSEGSVLAQAVAAHDLLARQPRIEETLVRLWLMGFTVEIERLRRAWLALIAKDERLVWSGVKEGRLPEDAVGDIVARPAGSMTRDREAFEHLSTVALEGLNVFFGTGEEVASYGLAAAAKATLQHFHPELPGAQQFAASDEDCVRMLDVLKDWISLPAQREIIGEAWEHEFVLSRRLLQWLGRRRQEAPELAARSSLAVRHRLRSSRYSGTDQLAAAAVGRRAVDIALQVSREMRRSPAAANFRYPQFAIA